MPEISIVTPGCNPRTIEAASPRPRRISPKYSSNLYRNYLPKLLTLMLLLAKQLGSIPQSLLNAARQSLKRRSGNCFTVGSQIDP